MLSAQKSRSKTRQVSPSISPGKVGGLMDVSEVIINTPTGGRLVRREIEDIALSRKPSPVKKKEVIDLWHNYRQKLWDDTCVDRQVDPSPAVGKNVDYSIGLVGSTRKTDALSTLAQLRKTTFRQEKEAPAPSYSHSPSVTSSSSLPDILPLDVVMRVRQILCDIGNEDIADMKPGYFQELVTLAHLVIRRSQEYYS